MCKISAKNIKLYGSIWLVLPNYKNINPEKTNFKLTTRATLKRNFHTDVLERAVRKCSLK